MSNSESFPKNFRNLLTIGLLAGLFLTYLEVKAIFSPDQVWGKLLTSMGTVTIAIYILLALLSLSVLGLSLWWPQLLERLGQSFRRMRWPLAVILIGLLVWAYLLSSWQATLTGPWTQFLIAAGLARFLAWCFNPESDRPFSWSDLALTFALFLYPRVVQELRIIFPITLISRLGIAAGFAVVLLLIVLLYESWSQDLRLHLLMLRGRLVKFRWELIILFLLLPVIYRYGHGAGGYILYPNIRFVVVLIALSVAAYLLCSEPDRLVSFESVGFSAAALVLVAAIIQALFLVVDNPFSQSWSEGNRLYDYSVVFAQNLYQYHGVIPDPYNTPGRYGLWGVLFLWPGLPIWVHRLWNVMLLTLPSFLLAWLLTRKLERSVLRSALFLWIAALFIIQAPLQPPFMIVTIIVAAFIFDSSPVRRGASLVVASLYASVSRWTWVVAPGAWGALTDLLLYYPSRKGNWFRRLLPTIAMALLGAVPGLILQAGYLARFSSGETLTSKQPLLWYRLLPNSTLGPGILLLMFITTGPVIALLLRQHATHQWKWDWLQHLAVWGTLIGFLGAGVVISTKIGGGGDLHNLDMYIATLVIVIALGLTGQAQSLDVKRWPAWALAMLCILFILPTYPFTPFSSSANYNGWLDLPTASETERGLQEIRSAVADAEKRGEVLFMDQRQLLTFGYVRNVPFVPEYEKKYMMDQALGSDAAYFKPYYQDLARKRFALILTEPLKVNLKDQNTGVFSEENDLWVKWVSAPTLCFYEPVLTDKAVGIQLLVPRENPTGCEKYLP